MVYLGRSSDAGVGRLAACHPGPLGSCSRRHCAGREVKCHSSRQAATGTGRRQVAGNQYWSANAVRAAVPAGNGRRAAAVAES
jgi:hypothetical protein